MITANELKHWLRVIVNPQKERAPRRNPSGLVAMYGSISSPMQGHVKVISRTGLFLETTERWPIGEVITLTLQREGPAAGNSELQVDVQARVASYHDNGVGLGFVLPEGLNANLWEHLVDTADIPTEADDTQLIFRMVRAVLFLYRLCPAKATEPIHNLTGELDEARTRNMLDIALLAEKMLAEEPDAENLRADSSMLATILKEGSWVKDQIAQLMWAGLLASSCSLEGTDQSNTELAELLSQMTINQVHILVEACRRSMEQSGGSEAGANSVIFTPEEVTQITGIYDFYRNATDISYLFGYGLIVKNHDFSTHGSKASFDVTPTPLGMKLFKICRGQMFDRLAASS